MNRECGRRENDKERRIAIHLWYRDRAVVRPDSSAGVGMNWISVDERLLDDGVDHTTRLLDKQIEWLIKLRSELYLCFSRPYVYYPGSVQCDYKLHWKNNDAQSTYEQAGEVLDYLRDISFRARRKEKKDEEDR